MNQLRIYTNIGDMGTPLEHRVFYSRRAGGPYYCWCYVKKPGRWRFSRVHPSVWALKAFRATNLRDMPMALQIKLDEHYG